MSVWPANRLARHADANDATSETHRQQPRDRYVRLQRDECRETRTCVAALHAIGDSRGQQAGGAVHGGIGPLYSCAAA